MEAFPIYSRAEFAADRVVHVVGLVAAAIGSVWLSASAAYNMARPSWAKAELRRVDRCMIFVMIAGTYTPFALGIMHHHIGVPLCITAAEFRCSTAFGPSCLVGQIAAWECGFHQPGVDSAN